MKRLSRKKRAQIYLKVAQHFVGNSRLDSCCFMLLETAKNYTPHYEMATTVFPEFGLFEPEIKENAPCWFDGEDADERRVLVMLLCHQMCINP